MIAIVDYGLGNLRSVAGAVRKLNYEPLITADPAGLEKCEKIIIPGVGAFGDGIGNLRRLGLADALDRMVLREHKPVLGICLGSQLMAKESFEFGHHKGLGWIDASVVKIDAPGVRIPHVGWNGLIQRKANMLFDGIPQDALFYYVHSYHIRCANPDDVIGECEYGNRFAAVLNRGNIYATQFHPEKSQLHGLKMLENFLAGARHA
ncbi:MAG: imidazole glycerol phosphate synthase subunit HisH [Candidatus Omnitrophica bacterium]|nr:imidazole glycerol phosphate synthase subunit HisH [Candidatus Omnitrophota bacterium]